MMVKKGYVDGTVDKSSADCCIESAFIQCIGRKSQHQVHKHWYWYLPFYSILNHES